MTPERRMELIKEMAEAEGISLETAISKYGETPRPSKSGSDNRRSANSGPVSSFMDVTLTESTIIQGSQAGPVRGAQATIEAGADAGSRVTATRLLAIGVFAFAAKKKTGHMYLTVEHPDYFVQVEFPVSRESEARKFTALINQRSRA